MALTFIGTTKTITLSSGTVSLDVRDLWSRWVDWLLTSDNSKYLFACMNLGGDDIDPGAGTKVPIYVFLLNGWKIKPQEANHTLNVTNGILLVSGGGDPFINTSGSFVVRINYQQPVQAISFSSDGGGGGLTTIEHDELFKMTNVEDKMVEVFKILGLDPAKPLVVTDAQRSAGVEIIQTIESDETTTTVTRQ